MVEVRRAIQTGMAEVAWTLDFCGPNRFAAAAQRWREIGATAAAAPEPGAPLTGPVALCGFGFDVAATQDARYFHGIDTVVFRLTSVNRFHVEGVAEGESDVLLST